MVPIDISTLLAIARELSSASNKLLIVVGPPASGNSWLLRRVSSEFGWPVVNVGKEISQRLLSLTKRQMRIKAAEVIGDALDAGSHQGLCLDRTEVIFDPGLALSPVNLLLNLSRNRTLVVAWNGHFENGSLVYAYPEHPEYYKRPANGFPVVTVSDATIIFFLQP